MAWTLPKTWNVGDVLASADLNTYVRDNSNYLFGDGNEVALTLASSVTIWGGGFFSPVCRRIGSMVWVGGVVGQTSGANFTSGGTFATLPTTGGFTPAGQVMVPALVYGSAGIGSASRIDVYPNGNMIFWAAGGNVWPTGQWLGFNGMYSTI